VLVSHHGHCLQLLVTLKLLLSNMAYKGMKRPAAASKGPAKKRPAKNTAKVMEVAAALSKAEALPESCRTMLATMIKESLTVYAAERHAFQAQIVDMAANTLSGIKKKLEQDITGAQATVDSADAEKASRTAANEAAKAKLAALTEAASQAKDTMRTDADAEKAATKGVIAAEERIKAKEEELATVGDKKAKLETTIKDVYEPAKTTKAAGAEGRSALATLGKVFGEFGLEASLLDSLADCLKKGEAERQTFDGIVLSEVEKFMAQRVAAMEETIKDGDNAKAANAANKTTAEANLAAATGKAAASKEANAAAQAAKAEGAAELAAATASLESYAGDMQVANDSLADAKDTLAAFLEGPFNSFAELKDLAPPPPPPEPEPVAEVAPEAAAAAPPA